MDLELSFLPWSRRGTNIVREPSGVTTFDKFSKQDLACSLDKQCFALLLSGST